MKKITLACAFLLISLISISQNVRQIIRQQVVNYQATSRSFNNVKMQTNQWNVQAAQSRYRGPGPTVGDYATMGSYLVAPEAALVDQGLNYAANRYQQSQGYNTVNTPTIITGNSRVNNYVTAGGAVVRLLTPTRAY